MIFRAAIVDDEPLARNRLHRLLRAASNGEIIVVVECVDVEDVLTEASQTPIDVLFLDIDLPGGDGFTALQRWVGPPPLVVFVTAYAQHGVRAFESRVVDYLLKPVSLERLRDAVQRIKEHAAMRGERLKILDSDRKHALPIGKRIQLIPERCINVVKASGNYLDISTMQGSFTIRRSLGDFLKELDEAHFMQVHRSVVVRSSGVRQVRPLGSGRYELILDSGERVVSGRNYRERIRLLTTGVNGLQDREAFQRKAKSGPADPGMGC